MSNDPTKSIISREVVSEPGAAIEVTKLTLSPEAKAGLTVGPVTFARRWGKQAARNEDARRLGAGEVTVDQLRDENGLIKPGVGVKIVDFGRSPRKRRPRSL